MTSHWTELGITLLDLLAPDRCAGCGTIVATPGPAWCDPCWDDLAWLPPDRCSACGEVLSGPRCGRCASEGRPWHRLVCAAEHRGQIRDLLTAYKYGSRPDLGRPLATLLRHAMAGLPERPNLDVIVPVPQSSGAWARRGFSPAMALARDLAGRRGLRLVSALRRCRGAPPQVGLTARDRRRNVRRLFEPHPGAARRIHGKRALLVDDVVTTGATAEACAQALLDGGASNVIVVAVARALP